MERYELPYGWEWVELGDLLSFVGSGITPKGGEKAYQPSGVPFIRSQNVYPNELRLANVAHVSPQMHAEMSRTHLQPRDVLLNITGASIGRCAVVPDIFGPGNVNQHVCILRPTDGLHPHYLSHLLNSPLGQDAIMEAQAGVTRQGLNYQQLRAITLPLPPLAEQRRIVAKLDALLAQARHSRTALDRLPTLLKQARQAILAAAFRGDLTKRDPAAEPADALLARLRAERRARWEADLHARGKDPAKHAYPEPAAPDTADLPELPDGWAWTSLTEVAWEAGYGTSEKCDYGARGRPVVRIPNIVAGRLDLTDLKHAETDRDVDQQSALAPGDLLVVRTNGSRDLIGRGALVTEELEQRYDYASYLIRFRLLPEVAGWIALAWSAPLVRRLIEDTAATSAGQYNVNLRNLSRLPIPLPPTAEQKRLVIQIQRTLAEADTIEAAARLARRRLDLAEQALLARAFRGELVPQDPADEPAGAMLASLRDARAAETNERKTETRTPRAKGRVARKKRRQPADTTTAVQRRLLL